MMKFTVVIDNYCAKSGMLAEWGYCSLLETEHGSVMIDTGGTGHVLRHNLDFLKVDLKKLSALVLSHSHHDHISGLLDIVFSCPGIPIILQVKASRLREEEVPTHREEAAACL